MSKKSIMRFSLPDWHTYENPEVFGSIGETVWSVQVSYDGTDWINIRRSLDNSQVQIDADVLIGTSSIISKYDEPLYAGQKNIRFSFEHSQNLRGALTGYITVHYDLIYPLTSYKEAVVQTEDSTYSPQLANDLLYLVNNPDSYSDATLVCSSSKIPVHRGILSARSPVFAAMFKTEMQEGRDGIVDIVDIELNVLQAMLKYVYTAKTDHLTFSVAVDMLFAADKYQLEELKMICVEKLKASVDASNVLRLVVLGDLHDNSLKAHAVEFICKYKKFSNLEKMEEWQSFQKDRITLALEITTTVIKYLQDK